MRLSCAAPFLVAPEHTSVHGVQKDNWRLRQHLMDLRRAARQAGCNVTNKDTLLTFPEVEHSLQANDSQTAAAVQHVQHVQGREEPHGRHEGAHTHERKAPHHVERHAHRYHQYSIEAVRGLEGQLLACGRVT